MVWDATTTNAISNAAHALFLLLYLIGACIHYLKKDHTFSLLIVFFFLNILVLKVLGVYVHYYPSHSHLPPAWIAISLLVIMLNYLLVQSMQMPDMCRVIVVFLSIVFTYLFLTHDGNYTYIAFPVILVYLIAAYYSQAKVRIGFVMVVISNVIWIVTRHIQNYIAGHEIPVEYRYDNDVYHIFLILSTYVIYRGIAEGQWKHPR
ncbi:hypothetical protein [Legionella sp. PATHC039]|uniref:hypothetical protein n=1 Tax=Legionella sp. PATHC039 TaxID=2992042 RepID=UPI002242ECBC|nr:hypothetical protein [Legionella sp. PATHC039]MCW8394371.1 hypothetical protein [Legionella sp. PATHC039]